MTPSDLLSTSFEFQQGAATKWSGRMTGAKPKVAALVEKGSIHRAESCINGVMTSDAVMLHAATFLEDSCYILLPYFHICSYLFTTFHVATGPAHGRHRQMEQEENGLGQNGTGPVGVLLPISTLLGWGNWQCWKQTWMHTMYKDTSDAGAVASSVETPNADRPGHTQDWYFSRQMWSAQRCTEAALHQQRSWSGSV